MLRIYCKICGSPSMYTLEKPKFCNGCGKELSTASDSPIPRKKSSPRIPTKVQKEEDYDYHNEEEEEEERIEIPHLDQLEVEIEARAPSTHTFGELGESEHSVFDVSDQALPRDKRSKEARVEAYQKEAGFKGKAPSPKPKGKPRGRPRGSKNKKK